jgi:wyosine [tRNA(Phe)-imidazoG37] synthetase (radical SAM superfamily)
MSGIPLQTGIIYGPILSRRLGRSLGINLLPTGCKVCSFNCIYCQYGPAKPVLPDHIDELFPAVDEVLRHVERALKKPRTINYLTFSGNGEPTLHPEFINIVRGVRFLRDKFRPEAQLAILSNSTGVTQPDVLAALNLMDVPMMKLDAGDEQTFTAINRPAQPEGFRNLVDGLKKIPNLRIQSMLVDGEISNVKGPSFTAWVDLLVDLQPHQIHIYSIERPPADEGLITVAPKKLEEIALELINNYGLKVKAFW